MRKAERCTAVGELIPNGNWRRVKNNLEYGLLRLFKTILPPHVRVILLADRGFGRTENGEVVSATGLSLHRANQSPMYGSLSWISAQAARLSVKKGMCRVLKCSEYRRHQPVEQRVVVRWKKGLPKRRDECWFLMSDLLTQPSLE